MQRPEPFPGSNYILCTGHFLRQRNMAKQAIPSGKHNARKRNFTVQIHEQLGCKYVASFGETTGVLKNDNFSTRG